MLTRRDPREMEGGEWRTGLRLQKRDVNPNGGAQWEASGQMGEHRAFPSEWPIEQGAF